MSYQRFMWGCRVLCTLTCLSTACTEPPAQQEGTVALVAQEAISGAELEEFAAGLLPGLRSKKSGQEARVDYVRTLIDEKLLVLEARSRGLDTTRTFRTNLEQAFRAHVVEYYRARHLYPQIEISEKEIRDRFVQDGFSREREMRLLVVSTAAAATRLREQIEERGADFSELARSHSIDKRRAPEGGYVGFVNTHRAERFFVPRQVFDTLPTGEVSRPLPVRDLFQLALFTQERAGDFTRGRGRIRGRLWKERLAIHSQALAEELALRFGLGMDGEGLKVLRQGKGQAASPGPKLTSSEAGTVLYGYDRGRITVGEYLDTFRGTGVRPGMGDSLAVAGAAWKHVIPRVLFWEAARQEGYHELPSMLEWRDREETDQLLKALRKKEVAEQVVLDEEEVEQFYRENPAFFEEAEEVWIQEVLVEDADQATQLRRRLDSGEEMDSLVHLSRRPGAQEKEGKWHVHPNQRPTFGNLVDQAFAADVGQVVGPVETKDGHSVFRVLEKSGGQLPFTEVSDRARATLRLREENRLFNVMVGAIREKYADQVQIFEEELSAVQIPGKDTPPPHVQQRRRNRLNKLAAEHFNGGRYDKAAETYQKVLEMDSSLVDAHYNLGAAYQKMGRVDEAISAYETAIRVDSTFIPTYHDLALALVHERDFQAAYRQLERALRIEPGSADTYRTLAFFYSAQEQFDRAEEALSKAVEADSSNSGAWRELGILYRQLGRSEDAEAPLLRAVELDPADKEALNELGGLYAEEGRYDEAERSLQQALEIDPDYAEAYYNLSQLRSAQGMVEEAQRMLARFESLSTSEMK